jgi:MarR family transcriptional regulator, organic hydroperoxide resistance regulator
MSSPYQLSGDRNESASEARRFDPARWPIAWMARAERQHARNATALLAPLGLHHREFRLLAFLGDGEAVGIGELAERAVLERTTLSKMFDRLEAEGWVERVASSGDRRRLPVRLTPAGRAKLEQATPVIEALFQRYQAGRPADEMARFSAELQDFYQRVRDSCPTAPDPDQI